MTDSTIIIVILGFIGCFISGVGVGIFTTRARQEHFSGSPEGLSEPPEDLITPSKPQRRSLDD